MIYKDIRRKIKDGGGQIDLEIITQGFPMVNRETLGTKFLIIDDPVPKIALRPGEEDDEDVAPASEHAAGTGDSGGGGAPTAGRAGVGSGSGAHTKGGAWDQYKDNDDRWKRGRGSGWSQSNGGAGRARREQGDEGWSRRSVSQSMGRTGPVDRDVFYSGDAVQEVEDGANLKYYVVGKGLSSGNRP